MSKLAFTCLSAAAALAIAVGCGDGDDGADSSDRTTSASTAQTEGEPAAAGATAFDRQAEEICLAGRDRVLANLNAYQKKNGTLNPRDIGVDAVSVTFLPVLREEADDISKLEPPSGDEKQVAALLAERRRALDEIERKRLSSNVELANALKRSDRLMLSYGLENCTFG